VNKKTSKWGNDQSSKESWYPQIFTCEWKRFRYQPLPRRFRI